MEQKIQEYNLSLYDFYLPPELIAQYPLKKRSESRLLVLNREKKSILDTKFSLLDRYLPEKSLLVFNQSKVIPARVYGVKKNTKGKVEFLLLTPVPLLEVKQRSGWNVCAAKGLLRPSRGVREGMVIIFCENFFLKVKKKHEFGQTEVQLWWKGDLTELLKEIGHVPLPPYIKRKDQELDSKRYQTIFAREDKLGSVAAPTAGLHFDEQIITALKNKGIEMEFITLYVGAGTFAPIRCEDVRNHKMHSEYVEMTKKTAKNITEAKEAGKKVIAVGTTTVRTLEGIYKKVGQLEEFSGWIDLFIYPGFKFNVIDHLITNFHLPKSSLLLLVSAFADREFILNAYSYAIKNRFRFFSYGDCMLIL
jgi:S-adenosylmethionine:tRNA ribosyltransferase-isomerase